LFAGKVSRHKAFTYERPGIFTLKEMFSCASI